MSLVMLKSQQKQTTIWKRQIIVSKMLMSQLNVMVVLALGVLCQQKL